MADFVKKKIVEKLAKFTKDLKPNDISLSFLRGKGELRNLELNADLINDALRLPPWIAINRVHCDSIRVAISFTDLNKTPIHAVLGQVDIHVSTCSENSGEAHKQAAALLKLKMKQGGSSYGLTEKIIDGMKVEIRSILVHFTNPVFRGRLEISDVLVESTTPSWVAAPLTHCRVKNEEEGSVIIYKKCTWTSLKIEGWEQRQDGVDSKNQSQLRLVTCMNEVRVALKRSLSDCHIMHMRVSVHLSDLMWVLTQSQLKATSMLVQSLIEAALKWAQQERDMQRGSQESVDSIGASSVGQPGEEMPDRIRRPTSARKNDKETMKKDATRRKVEWEYQEGQRSLPAYEVIQDSFHIKTGLVDLQLCDDKGSLLLQLKDLLVDIYPDQQATTGRGHWHKANCKLDDNVQWSRDLVKLSSKVQHMDLPSVSLYQLRERGIVVRCSNFQIRPLTGTDELLPIIASDKETFSIPDENENPAFQVGLTMYYYPTNQAHRFLVPRPNLYVYLSPIHVNFHQKHCLWLVEFLHGVIRTVNLDLALAVHSETSTFLENMKAKRASVKQLPGIDMQIYVPYSKITLPLTKKFSDGRPRALQLETSSVSLQNRTLVSLFESPPFLAAWESISNNWLSSTVGQFPHSDEDPSPIPENLKELINTELKTRKGNSTLGSSSPRSTRELERRKKERFASDEKIFSKMSLEQLKLSTIDCWHVATECVCVTFVDDLSHEATLYTTEFITDFPLSAWVFWPKKIAETLETPSTSLPMIHAMIHAPKPINVQIKFLHYLFLMRLKDSFRDFKTSLMQMLSLDSLISAQEEEAFHTQLQESDDEAVEGDSSDGRDLKERISAAFARMTKKDSDSDRDDMSESTKEKSPDVADGPTVSSGPSVTVSSSLNGLKVSVLLPSIDKKVKTPTTPTPGSAPPPSTPPRSHSRMKHLTVSSSPIPSPRVLKETDKTYSLPLLNVKRDDSTEIKQSPLLPVAASSIQFVSKGNEDEDEGFTFIHSPRSPTHLANVSIQVQDTEEELAENTQNESIKKIEEEVEEGTDTLEMAVEGDILSSSEILDTSEDQQEPVNESDEPQDTRVSPEEKRKQSPEKSSLPVSPLPNSPPIIPVLYILTGEVAILLEVSGPSIRVSAAVNNVAINELKVDEVSSVKGKCKVPQPLECPVIKARVELGSKAGGYFKDLDWDPDSVTFLKVSGLDTTLAMSTLMAVKDFFDDEVETVYPMPVQIRILETHLNLRHKLMAGLSDPHNLTVNVPDLFVNRGPKAIGTNLIKLPTTSVMPEPAATTPDPSEFPSTEGTAVISSKETKSKSLLESFKGFIKVFQAHVAETGEVNLPHPERVSQLLQQLKGSLSSPPSYTEAISCDFYNNATAQLPHPTVVSLQAEVERLSRENVQLTEELGAATKERTITQEENSDITQQLVMAKVDLASAHLVLEQQKRKIEHLSNEKMNLEELLRIRTPSPL